MKDTISKVNIAKKIFVAHITKNFTKSQDRSVEKQVGSSQRKPKWPINENEILKFMSNQENANEYNKILFHSHQVYKN